MDKIREAVDVLKSGGTLLYPTDTIWGVGCDATNEEAVEKIVALKNRPATKSFIVLVSNVAMLERYISDFPEVCYDIIDFSTKPTTIIYEKAIGIAKNVLADDGSIGIRVTNDPICQKLIQGLRKPIVSTSANLSGQNSPKNFTEVDSQIKKGVDFILEERINEEMVKPSTIIKINNDNSVRVIRK